MQDVCSIETNVPDKRRQTSHNVTLFYILYGIKKKALSGYHLRLSVCQSVTKYRQMKFCWVLMKFNIGVPSKRGSLHYQNLIKNIYLNLDTRDSLLRMWNKHNWFRIIPKGGTLHPVRKTKNASRVNIRGYQWNAQKAGTNAFGKLSVFTVLSLREVLWLFVTNLVRGF